LVSTEEFAKLSPANQKRYAWLRHPLMIFPGGFFYLAIKPRMALIMGIYGLIRHFFACLQKNEGLSLPEIFASYKSRNWYTTAEFWDLLLNNICVIGSWVALSHWLGAGFFLGIYFITLTISAAIFICVFFVQHNFDGSYAHKTEGWDYLLGAIEGSSYLKLPAILNWFSADIGYHNIHHLSERIPNYNLQACHQENLHLLTKSKVLELGDIPDCFKYLLWDAASDSLISIESFNRSSRLESVTPIATLAGVGD
jgi:acyl-lipid omega-6 desaturase (Delta-12 desaturase)